MPQHYTVAIVGAGRLATQLAPALQHAGHSIKAVYSRTLDAARELCQKLTNNIHVQATDNIETLPATDVYIVAVADHALPTILAAWPERAKGGVVIHTAGSMPMQLLESVSAHFGVLYPMQTFSKEKSVDFKNIHIYIESNDAVSEKITKDIAFSLSNHVEFLPSAGRKHLHLAAVIACNFTNHLYELAFEYLSSHGIQPQCLLPLIDETTEKLHKVLPHDGQTGPARRGDDKVIGEHLSMLEDTPQLRDIYRMLSESIIQHFRQVL